MVDAGAVVVVEVGAPDAVARVVRAGASWTTAATTPVQPTRIASAPVAVDFHATRAEVDPQILTPE